MTVVRRRNDSTHASYAFSSGIQGKVGFMSRMVMMWLFGVPLSVMLLLKVFGIL
jgi:hypothetical protein